MSTAETDAECGERTCQAIAGMGLESAAVLEGIRRCGALGARVPYVFSDQPFYRSIGFAKVYDTECWLKYFD